MRSLGPSVLLVLSAALSAAACLNVPATAAPDQASPPAAERIPLPSPRLSGQLSLEEALAARRSVREFEPAPLSLAQVGQLCWAAQGITSASGGRTAPSAGALHPLELYVLTGDGIFHYLPGPHALERLTHTDRRTALRAAAWDQEAVSQAPAVIAVTAVPQRTSAKYGPERAERYVWLEAGHAAQNILLEAVALGLGAVPIGAFQDDAVRDVLDLPAATIPLYLVPVGHRG